MPALLYLLLAFAEPTEIRGKVVSIADGDTLTVLVDRQQVKVRLEGIDSPEAKQAFGARAREALGKLVHDKQVTVKVTGKDRYGRSLGVVLLDGVNVNQKMVADGYAWHFKRYSKDKTLAELEVKARSAKAGLWADKDPMPPWEWRKTKEATSP